MAHDFSNNVALQDSCKRHTTLSLGTVPRQSSTAPLLSISVISDILLILKRPFNVLYMAKGITNPLSHGLEVNIWYCNVFLTRNDHTVFHLNCLCVHARARCQFVISIEYSLILYSLVVQNIDSVKRSSDNTVFLIAYKNNYIIFVVYLDIYMYVCVKFILVAK